MKTDPALKILKVSTLIPLVIAIAATLTTPTLRADATNSLVLTENSSTSLTGTYTETDGTTDPVGITFNAPDNWTVMVEETVFTQTAAWAEPESSTSANVVTGATTHLDVVSDTSTTLSINPNGSQVDIGTDSGNGAAIFLTFNDNAATAESAPDTGSTLGLLALALAGLFGASRVRSLRLA